MTRRSLLAAVSSLPFLGWLAPAPPAVKQASFALWEMICMLHRVEELVMSAMPRSTLVESDTRSRVREIFYKHWNELLRSHGATAECRLSLAEYSRIRFESGVCSLDYAWMEQGAGGPGWYRPGQPEPLCTTNGNCTVIVGREQNPSRNS